MFVVVYNNSVVYVVVMGNTTKLTVHHKGRTEQESNADDVIPILSPWGQVE